MGLCYSSKSPPATFSFTYLLQPHWLLCCFLPSTPWSKASDCCSLWSILACDSIMAHYFTLFRTLFKCHLIRGLSSLITLPKIAPPSFSIPAVLNQGWLCSLGISDNIWRHFWLLHWEVLLASSGVEVRDTATHLTIHRIAPHNKLLSSPNHQQCPGWESLFLLYALIGHFFHIICHDLTVYYVLICSLSLPLEWELYKGFLIH